MCSCTTRVLVNKNTAIMVFSCIVFSFTFKVFPLSLKHVCSDFFKLELLCSWQVKKIIQGIYLENHEEG